MTTPVGGGIRSLNVALRQILDLYSCVRPVKYYKGVPSPVKHPERMNVVIFRENTEDVYAGVEWEQGTAECAKLIEFLNKDMLKGGKKQIRLDSGVGIKPISITGTKRLVRMAIQHAIENRLKVGHAGAQGQHPEIYRRRVPQMGIRGCHRGIPRQGCHRARELDSRQQRLESEYHSRSECRSDRTRHGVRSACLPPVRRERSEGNSGCDLCDARQRRVEEEDHDQRPHRRFDLPADRDAAGRILGAGQPNLNGDYISDAAAAQVGGLGIAPGANIGDGYAIFEATHGTAPKYADKDVINPGSVILSGVMMFRHLGWNEAADLIEQSMERTIEQKKVTYDFERLMEGATKVKTSEFASYMIENMGAGVLV